MAEQERKYEHQLKALCFEAYSLCEDIFGPESLQEINGEHPEQVFDEAWNNLSAENNEARATELFDSLGSKHPGINFLRPVQRAILGLRTEGWSEAEKRILFETAIDAGFHAYDHIFLAEERGRYYKGELTIGIVGHVSAVTGFSPEKAAGSLGKIRTWREGLTTLKQKLRQPATSNDPARRK